jgi:hypothetical protein
MASGPHTLSLVYSPSGHGIRTIRHRLSSNGVLGSGSSHDWVHGLLLSGQHDEMENKLTSPPWQALFSSITIVFGQDKCTLSWHGLVCILRHFLSPFLFFPSFLPPALFPFSIASIPRRYLETSNFQRYPPWRGNTIRTWLSKALGHFFSNTPGSARLCRGRAHSVRRARRAQGQARSEGRGNLMGLVGRVCVVRWGSGCKAVDGGCSGQMVGPAM